MYTPAAKPVQLVKNFDKVPENKRKFPLLAHIKYDGSFAYGLCIKGDNRIFSRTGKQYHSLKHIEAELAACADSEVFRPFVVIFEVMADNMDCATISGNCRSTKRQFPQAYGRVHDLIPYQDFVDGVCDLPYRLRLAASQIIAEQFTCFEPIESWQVSTQEEAREFASAQIESGEEGAVFCDPEGTWTAGKRNERKMKIKMDLSYDLEVIGMEPGQGKYAGTLGKLVCKFRRFGDADGDRVEVFVSGMSDEQRNTWWNDPDSICGKIVQVDGMSFTKYGMLREPRFKMVRHDKEKADF